MALNQINLKGVMYAFGTSADIVSASGGYVIGRRYVATSDGFPTGTFVKVGTAVSATVVNWDITQAALDAVSALVAANTAAIAANATAIAAEVTRATAAEGVNATAIATETTNRQTAVAAEASTRAAAITTLTTNLAAEATARQGGDDALSAALTTEQTARITGDYNLGLRIDGEITRATAAESALSTAYQAADAALNTSLTTALNSAVANLRDTTVSDLIKVRYINGGQPVALAEALGSGRPDGIYALMFVSDDGVSAVTTVTGLPSGTAAGTGSITYGDTLRVVVDGGVVTTVVKIDDITKQKFDSIDTSISALQAATTTSAIRSHFSASGDITYANGVIGLVVSNTNIQYLNDQLNASDTTVSVTVSDIYAKIAAINTNGAFGASNGLTKTGNNVVLGGALTGNTALTGAYEMKFSNDTTVVDGVFKMPIWSVNANGSKNTKGSTFVEVWFDGSGINYVFPN